MGPKPTTPSKSQPPLPRLDEQINLAHLLARLAALTYGDCPTFEGATAQNSTAMIN